MASYNSSSIEVKKEGGKKRPSIIVEVYKSVISNFKDMGRVAGV
jgi:hypothetical protein